MAHLILEYSANLPADELRLDALLAALHATVAGTGIFPLAGIRSRALRCEHFRVADGDPTHAFVHLTMKVGSGRSEAELESAAIAVDAVLGAHFEPVFDLRGLALSMEIVELHPRLRFNRNNLRDRMDAAAGGAGA